MLKIKIRNIWIYLLVIALFLSSFTALFGAKSVSAATAATTKEKVEGKIYYSYEWQLLSLVNKERAKRGLSKLKMSEGLNKASNRRAAEVSLYYSHQRPNGERGLDIYPWKRAVGENLALNCKTPKQVVKEWLNSPTHKKNMLNTRYKSAGIGCFYSNKTLYWELYLCDTRLKKNCKKKADCTATYTVEIKKKYVNTYQKRTTIDFEDTEAKTLTLYQCTNTFNGYDFITPLKTDCVAFETDDSTVVEVDRNGKIVPKGNGSATVTAYVKGAENSKVIWTVSVALPQFEEEEDDTPKEDTDVSLENADLGLHQE